MSEWMPIETAPKDGTWIVAVGELAVQGSELFRGMPRACVTCWYDYDDRHKSPAHCSGWFWSSPGYAATFNPTHWQPLPSPPTKDRPNE